MPDLPTFQLSIDYRGRSGAENMAIDASLLAESHATGRAFLRLYRFEPPCLSLGRNEPTAHYDRAAIARLGLDAVRRPTGGGAVWHEHEVTYAVAAPIATFGEGLREAYHAIHARLTTALRALGVAATIAPDHPTGRPRDRGSPCFAAPVGGEVLVEARKVIGSAQVRHGGSFLQHGSILLAGSQEMVRLVSRERGAGSGETTLSTVLGRPVTFSEVVDAIVAAWGDDITSTNLHQPPPTSTTVFSDPAWTWRR